MQLSRWIGITRHFHYLYLIDQVVDWVNAMTNACTEDLKKLCPVDTSAAFNRMPFFFSP